LICPKTFVSDVIELRELRCSAVVGVLSEERERPQPLAFDIYVVRPFEEAAMNDDITETTNYATVLSLATQVASDGAFLLLETLAYRVAREVLAIDPLISSVTVAVRKLRPPVPEDVATVGVRTTVQRP
jgi:dihydroneopterin aldolase